MINLIAGKVLILFFFLPVFLQLKAQSDSLYLSPSVYFTHGFYSDKTNSDAISFYNTLETVKKFYLINHFDNLAIKHNEWDYDQNTFLAGVLADLFPFYLKLNYAHYAGAYSASNFDYSYNDYTNLYNIDVSCYTDSWYLGTSYVYSNKIGFANQQTNQVTLRVEKIISLNVFLSLKPTYSKSIDGRGYYSLFAKIHYQPDTDILLKAGGFAGKRTNYFDSDLLTFFNQEDIQKYQVFGQAEYDAFKWLRLIFSYQSTAFEHFRINYIVFGIKSNLYL